MRKNKSIVWFYKRHYEIILNEDLLFNTYDEIQWYRWTVLEKTPNGKFLTNLPSDLINFDSIKIIARYVIENILNFRSREDKIKLSQPIINEYKISFSKTEGIKNSPYNLLSLAFPELNIQPWEMFRVPVGFWKNYNNFLDAVKFYYNDILNDTMRLDLDIYFLDGNIDKIFPKLTRMKYEYYSHLGWKDILKDIGIHHEFKNKPIAYDGTVMNSNEEVLVYNFIHMELGIKSMKNIAFKRTGKYYFKNPTIKESYCPDFVIESIEINGNFIKLDKPLIIEYYGLYTKNYRKEKTISDRIVNEYRGKTHRKNEFYENLQEINFIAIYPKDLNSKCKGVKQKFTSFFMDKYGILLKGGEIIERDPSISS